MSGAPASAKPVLVILAAGASRRLGTCKALCELAPGVTPLSHLLAAGRAFDNVAPVVVTGADHVSIAATLADGPGSSAARIIENADWAAGRSGSVRAAARALAGRDLCLAPVDVPLVPPEVFEALVEAWLAAASPARGWLGPRHGEHYGHPLIVGRELAGELEKMSPDRPLRDLRAQADPLLSVDVDSPEILTDLDTPDDLFEIRKRLG